MAEARRRTAVAAAAVAAGELTGTRPARVTSSQRWTDSAVSV